MYKISFCTALLAGYAYAAGGGPSKLEVAPIPDGDPNKAILRHDQTENMLGAFPSDNEPADNSLELTMIVAAQDLDRTKHELRGSLVLKIPNASDGQVQMGFAFAPLPAPEKKKQQEEAPAEEADEAEEADASERRMLAKESANVYYKETRTPTEPFEGAVATVQLSVTDPASTSFTSAGIYFDGEVDTFNEGIGSLGTIGTNNYLIDAENSKAECDNSDCTITWKWVRPFDVAEGTGHTIEEMVEVDYATYAFYSYAGGKGQNKDPAVFPLGAMYGLSQVIFAATLMLATFAF